MIRGSAGQYHLRKRVAERRTRNQRSESGVLDHPLTQVVLTCDPRYSR